MSTLKTNFVIQDTQQRLKDYQIVRRIENLFAVDVSVSHCHHSQGEWVTLGGPTENTTKAKRYISALCGPESLTKVTSDTGLAALLFGENSCLRDEIEREYQTVTWPSSTGIHVQGSEYDVCLTVSRLQSLVDTMIDGRKPSEPPAANRYPQLDQQLKEALQPSNIDRLPDSVKRAILEELDRGTEMAPPVHCAGFSAVDPDRQRKSEFAVRLGYSEDKVQAVIQSLGPDATEDDILARLVKLSAKQLPAISSQVKKLSSRSYTAGEPLLSMPIPAKDPSCLRPIVIDGSNVAMRHGNGRVFSCRGILLAVEWFRKRGHQHITVFVPSWRKEAPRPEAPISDQDVLLQLEKEDTLVFTPSKRIRNRRIVCYDDRFIVRLATLNKGVIVSNDNYRDLLNENPSWRETIEKRVLMFTFVNDIFMVPEDPLGRYGPGLEQFLQLDSKPVLAKGPTSEKQPSQVCPYGDRCTFGKKCRYYHPEKEGKDSNPSSRTSSRSTTPTMERRPPPHSIKNSREDLRSLHSNTSSAEDIYANERPELTKGLEVAPQLDRPNELDIKELDDHVHRLNLFPSPQKGNQSTYECDSMSSSAFCPNLSPERKHHLHVGLQPSLDQSGSSERLRPSSAVIRAGLETQSPSASTERRTYPIAHVRPAREEPGFQTFAPNGMMTCGGTTEDRPAAYLTGDPSGPILARSIPYSPASEPHRSSVDIPAIPHSRLSIPHYNQHVSPYSTPRTHHEAYPQPLRTLGESSYQDQYNHHISPYTPSRSHETHSQPLRTIGESSYRNQYNQHISPYSTVRTHEAYPQPIHTLEESSSFQERYNQPYSTHEPYPQPLGESYQDQYLLVSRHPQQSYSLPLVERYPPTNMSYATRPSNQVHSYRVRPTTDQSVYAQQNFPSQPLHGSQHSIDVERDMVYHEQHQSSRTLFEQAKAVLPGLEEQIHLVMQQYPHVKDLNFIVDCVQRLFE